MSLEYVCCIPDITIILLFKFTVAMFKQDLYIFYAAVVNEFKTTSSYVLLRQFTILTVIEKTVLKIIANLMVNVWGGAGHVIQATLLPPPADLHIGTELHDWIWTDT